MPRNPGRHVAPLGRGKGASSARYIDHRSQIASRDGNTAFDRSSGQTVRILTKAQVVRSDEPPPLASLGN